MIQTSDSVLFPQISTPVSPGLGNYKVYFKSDGKMYYVNSSGVETQLGADINVFVPYTGATLDVSLGAHNVLTSGRYYMSATANPFPSAFSAWKYCKKITLGLADADLTNFPLEVAWDSDTDIGANALSTGYDIRFIDSSGNNLSYQRDWYSITPTNQGRFVVKVPTISSTTPTIIYLLYCNPSATDGEDRTHVWDDNFLTVYNFGGYDNRRKDGTSFATVNAQFKRDSKGSNNAVDGSVSYNWGGGTCPGSRDNLGYSTGLQGYGYIAGAEAWWKYASANLPSSTNTRTYEVVDFMSGSSTNGYKIYSHGTYAGTTPVYVPAITNPTILSGLLAWYDASQETYNDGDLVATVTDRSGTSHNATATGTMRPTFKTNVTNGKPVYRFDGVTNEISMPSIVNKTIILVANNTKSTTGFTGSQYLTANSTGGGQQITANSGGQVLVQTGSYAQGIYVNNGTADFRPFSTFKIVSAMQDYSAANVRTFGAYGAQQFCWGGDIAEIIIYNRVLTTRERNMVEGYLAVKYGMAYGGPVDYYTGGQAVNIRSSSFDVGDGLLRIYGGTASNYQGVTYDGTTLKATNDGTTYTQEYRFTVTGVTTPPIATNTYTVSGLTFTVIGFNLDYLGVGTLVCSGLANPPASGSLVRASGAGTTPISYSAFATGTILNTTNGSYAYTGSDVQLTTTSTSINGIVTNIRVSNIVRSSAWMKYTKLNTALGNNLTFDSQRLALTPDNWIGVKSGILELAMGSILGASWNGTTWAFAYPLSVTGAITATGAISVTSATLTGMTSGRVVYSTTGGLLTSNAFLTFNGVDLGVQGNVGASTLSSSLNVSVGNYISIGTYLTAGSYLQANNLVLNENSNSKFITYNGASVGTGRVQSITTMQGNSTTVGPKDGSDGNQQGWKFESMVKVQVKGGDGNLKERWMPDYSYHCGIDCQCNIECSCNSDAPPACGCNGDCVCNFNSGCGVNCSCNTDGCAPNCSCNTDVQNCTCNSDASHCSCNTNTRCGCDTNIPSCMCNVDCSCNADCACNTDAGCGTNCACNTDSCSMNCNVDGCGSDCGCNTDGPACGINCACNTNGCGENITCATNCTCNTDCGCEGCNGNCSCNTDTSGCGCNGDCVCNADSAGSSVAHYKMNDYNCPSECSCNTDTGYNYQKSCGANTFQSIYSGSCYTDCGIGDVGPYQGAAQYDTGGTVYTVDDPVDNGSYIDYRTDGLGSFTATGLTRNYGAYSKKTQFGTDFWSATPMSVTLTDDASNGTTIADSANPTAVENSSGTSDYTATQIVDYQIYAYVEVHGQKVYSTNAVAPTQVTIGTAGDGVKVDWDSVTGATGYVVIRTVDAGGTGEKTDAVDVLTNTLDDEGTSTGWTTAPDVSCKAATITYNNVIKITSAASSWTYTMSYLPSVGVDTNYYYQDSTSDTIEDNDTGWTYVGSSIPWSPAAQSPQHLHILSGTGMINQAISFDGTNDYVTLASTSGLFANDWSIALWWYNRGDGAIFSTRSTNSACGMVLSISSGELYLSASSDNTNWDVASALDCGTPVSGWNHIAITKSSTGWNIYLNNGTPVNISTGSSPSTSADLVLGADPIGSNMGNGIIDDVRIYSMGISSGLVSAIWNTGMGTEDEISCQCNHDGSGCFCNTDTGGCTCNADAMSCTCNTDSGCGTNGCAPECGCNTDGCGPDCACNSDCGGHCYVDYGCPGNCSGNCACNQDCGVGDCPGNCQCNTNTGCGSNCICNLNCTCNIDACSSNCGTDCTCNTDSGCGTNCSCNANCMCNADCSCNIECMCNTNSGCGCNTNTATCPCNNDSSLA